ncbi:LapA family protein [Mycobacterium sp. Aquia_216]|uniref:LapA family protein n=1 Tax=Mycobacterium sp. Aquia_216 TaxID=2991729 RepID=UPI00227CE087|nr:LapA family protein [Mycobacterium sp. Aquia_216]WAJ42609.1 LapA family protein [Mycobacterium sp. Aquia_216]
MRRNNRNPVDHDRTSARSTDRPPQDSVRTPGLIVVGAAVLALVVCVTNFALGEVSVGVTAAIIGLMALGAGLDWLSMDRRRIRQAERDWFVSHPTR